jgi:hypothetical protein
MLVWGSPPVKCRLDIPLDGDMPMNRIWGNFGVNIHDWLRMSDETRRSIMRRERRRPARAMFPSVV